MNSTTAKLAEQLLNAAERTNERSKEFINPWGKLEQGPMLLQRIWRKQEDAASRLRN